MLAAYMNSFIRHFKITEQDLKTRGAFPNEMFVDKDPSQMGDYDDGDDEDYRSDIQDDDDESIKNVVDSQPASG